MQSSSVRPTDDPVSFTVRPLPPGSILDGAFRVHIPSRELDMLKLKPGDLCHLTSLEGHLGTGIVWRSNEQNTKAQTRPVKLTETIREAFGFKLGNHVNISRTTNRILHAERVTIVDVSDKIDPIKDHESWRWRCGDILSNVEAIANSVAFEASRKGVKRRFLIEGIKSQAGDISSLYHVDDHTEVIIEKEPHIPASAEAPLQSLALTTEGIGGLHLQIEALNRSLERLIGQFKGRTIPVQNNDGILLFGPEGTGKSLLLSRLSRAPWRKVVAINRSTLPGTLSKNQAAVRSAIAEAVSHQPSLVVMDDVHQIAGSQESDQGSASLSSTLAVELDSLKGSQVLVVATTVSLGSVDKSLRIDDRLCCEVEIPVPDMKARVDILKVLHKDYGYVGPKYDTLAKAIGDRTHAYVGRDLRSLCKNARNHAIDRALESQDWIHDDDGTASISPAADGASQTDNTPTSEHKLEIDLTEADYEGALLKVRPTAMKEVFLEIPKVHWNEIGGSQKVQQALNEVIEWPLRYPAQMANLNLTSSKGILFYGPPGCSKTLTAKAIATSSGLNFLGVKGAELTSMYVGESERAMREVFRKARAAAPSIIFFDEIDSIAAERDGGGGTKGLNVMTTLLNEMDGMEALNGVLVLAATNRPDLLDSAVIRPGRFDNLIYIGPPDESARREILRIRTRKVKLASDINLDDVALRTQGFSGAEMVQICSEASKAAMRQFIAAGADPTAEVSVSRENFEEALSGAVRSITQETVAGYVRWRDSRAP